MNQFLKYLFFLGMIFLLVSAPIVEAQEIFEPGVISIIGQHDDYITFGPDENFLAFTRLTDNYRSGTIFFSVRKSGKWQEPYIAPFSGEFNDSRPFISPEGTRIYFASNRPTSENPDKRDLDIWYVDKIGDNWSEPTNAGELINSSQNESHPSVAISGNLYFTRWSNRTPNDIYISKFVDGEFTLPELHPTANTYHSDSHPFIDPKENFLLFGSTRDQEGLNGEVYITIQQNGKWSVPEKMELVNSDLYEYSAKVSPDKQHIYFSRTDFSENGERADIYVTSLELNELLNKYQSQAAFPDSLSILRTLKEKTDFEDFNLLIRIINTGNKNFMLNFFDGDSVTVNFYMELHDKFGELSFKGVKDDHEIFWTESRKLEEWVGFELNKVEGQTSINSYQRGIPDPKFNSNIPTRYIRNNTFHSESIPRITLEVDKDFNYVGQFFFEIKANSEEYDDEIRGEVIADGHRFVFVSADSDKKVQKLFIIQLEGFLASNDFIYNYDFSNAELLGDNKYRHNTWFYDSSELAAQNPENEGAKTRFFLTDLGYKIEDEFMMSRFVGLASEDRKHEIILYYIEIMKHSTKYSLDDIENIVSHEKIESIRQSLTKRSKQSFKIIKG